MGHEHKLSERLSKLLKRPACEIEEATNLWPIPRKASLEQPCWPGPRFIWFKGAPCPMPRAILAYILGEMHPSWHVRRTCADPTCANPFHQSLVSVRLKDSDVPPQPLPWRAMTGEEEFELLTDTDAQLSVDDVIDLTLRMDARAKTATELAAMFDCPVDLCIHALERIQAEGL